MSWTSAVIGTIKSQLSSGLLVTTASKGASLEASADTKQNRRCDRQAEPAICNACLWSGGLPMFVGLCDYRNSETQGRTPRLEVEKERGRKEPRRYLQSEQLPRDSLFSNIQPCLGKRGLIPETTRPPILGKGDSDVISLRQEASHE